MPPGGTTFHPFPNLPIELQTKIWHHALPGPRIIQVCRQVCRDDGSISFYFNGAHPPPVLHTCITSREVASSSFEAAFKHNNTNKPLSPIYIDFARDTIYLTTPCDPRTVPYTELAWLFPDTKKIQSLAVEVSSPDEIEMALTHIMMALKKIEGSLKEIVVVVEHQSHPIHEYKYPESVRFSEPEARPWSPWQTWKNMEAHWTKGFPEGCVVRFMEAKMV
jgi:hypothetical protein